MGTQGPETYSPPSAKTQILGQTTTILAVEAPAASAVSAAGPLIYHLLQHILTFLPTTEAIRMTMLSRRWWHVWTRIPALYLCDDKIGAGGLRNMDQFIDFVDKALVRYASTMMESLDIVAGNWSNALRVGRGLFHKARLSAPCILFVDELDSALRCQSLGAGKVRRPLHVNPAMEFP